MRGFSLVLALLASGAAPATSRPSAHPAPAGRAAASPRFEISFPASVHAEPITGRVFLAISRDSAPPPIANAGSFTNSTPLFGLDVSALAPGQPAVIDASTPGYPTVSLGDIPAGDYWVQAVMNVYTEFHRADGHTIWAHMDQWEGQNFTTSPGNLVSAPQRVHFGPDAASDVKLSLTHVIPPIVMPPDTKWVKHIKIQSALLTKFWGHPFYLGATVLLPAGYDTHPNVHYPVVFQQGHFGLGAPLGFNPDSFPLPPQYVALFKSYNLEPGWVFARQWMGPGMPRMIAVTFQHPTPYFDDSYAVNSANNGPYGDAIMTELIPYLESHFRMIQAPYARVLTGGSTGGWESIALQIYHPKFFGGTWTLYPDPVDFHHYGTVDAYVDTNAFVDDAPGIAPFSPISSWYHPERMVMRDNDGQPWLSLRDFSRLEDVLGSHGRSGEQLEAWESVYGPVGDDGYPKPLWDKKTGHIDRSVIDYMRDHGYDLEAYLARNWKTVGPNLVDKIHVDVGDMDNFYLNLAVMDLQRFLDSTKSPHVPGVFRYGRPEKGHGWQHVPNSELLREMAAAITRHAPPGTNTNAWKY
jgi:Putative esterase